MDILFILGVGFLIGSSIAYAINKLCLTQSIMLAIEPNYENNQINNNNNMNETNDDDEVPPKYEDI